jgi:hypothetical protein
MAERNLGKIEVASSILATGSTPIEHPNSQRTNGVLAPSFLVRLGYHPLKVETRVQISSGLQGGTMSGHTPWREIQHKKQLRLAKHAKPSWFRRLKRRLEAYTKRTLDKLKY